MTYKADKLALRAIIGATIALCLLFLAREYAVDMFDPQVELDDGPDEATPTPTPSPTPRRIAAAPPAATPLPARYVPPQPEVRRTVPVVRTTPTPARVARHFVVTAPPKGWSRLVEVPDGKEGTITFSLGRLRIERNGVDLGIVYRKRSIEGTVVNGQPEVSKVDLGAFFDKTPRTLTIDPGTRTLRFSSMERVGGSVVVDFSP